MDWLPFAQRLPLRINFMTGGMRRPIRGLVLHITTGHPTPGGLFSTWSHSDRQVSAHFAVTRDAGRIIQYIDLRDSSYAVGGDRRRNDDQYWYSIESVARAGEDLTGAQIEAAARLLAWFHNNMGVPLQIADTRDEFGLGYHSMFHRGSHRNCPGRRVIAQRKEIIDLAQTLRT